MTTIKRIEHLPMVPQRNSEGHKGTYGTVLGIGGSRGMAGAVALAGRAALSGGAGLVRLAIPDPILETVAGFYPEPTTIPCSADRSGRLALDALEPLLELAATSSCIFLGPGLGRSSDLDALVLKLVVKVAGKLAKPMVLDADGLNALSRSDLFVDWGRTFEYGVEDVHFPSGLVMTPHPGEFARLTGKPTPPESCREERFEAAFDFAQKYRVVLVLKGHETITTDGERVFVNTTGNPGMATGGSGDVLTGLIAALLAQRIFNAFDSARFGVYLHGLAGDIASERYGQESVTATAILEAVPEAFKVYRRSIRPDQAKEGLA